MKFISRVYDLAWRLGDLALAVAVDLTANLPAAAVIFALLVVIEALLPAAKLILRGLGVMVGVAVSAHWYRTNPPWLWVVYVVGLLLAIMPSRQRQKIIYLAEVACAVAVALAVSSMLWMCATCVVFSQEPLDVCVHQQVIHCLGRMVREWV